MKRAFNNPVVPVVKVDIVTGRVLLCRIQELWAQMEALSMTDEEYSVWIKQETARQQREFQARVAAMERFKDDNQGTVPNFRRRKGNPIHPVVLEYLLAELDMGVETKELAKKTGVASTTIHKMRREPDKYRRYLEVYKLCEQGLGIQEIVAETGLTTGTVRNLIGKYKAWSLNQLAS